ncbi:MAG: MMPL family transporter [Verrucomicrobiota bacterium]
MVAVGMRGVAWRGGLFILLLLIGVTGLSRIRLDADASKILPQEVPEIRGMALFREHFSSEEELFLTVAGPSPEEVAAAAEDLAEFFQGREELVESVLWRNPLSLPGESQSQAEAQQQLAAAAEWIAWQWWNGDSERLAAGVEGWSAEGLGRTMAEAIEEASFGEALSAFDPLQLLAPWAEEAGRSQSPMVAAEGRFRMVILKARPEFAGSGSAMAWLADVRGAFQEWQAGEGARGSGCRFGLTGETAFLDETGAAMERDMRQSLLITSGLIGLLFWLAHGRLKPLLVLLLALAFVLVLTLGLGGWILRDLTLLSAGFAAILLGLVVDYAMVVFQEGRTAGVDAREVRRRVAPGLFWAAATTGGIFLSLNLSSVPGIGQLGALVALGVLVGAWVMAFPFAQWAGRQSAEEGHAWRLPSWDLPSWCGPLGGGLLGLGVALVLVLGGLPELRKGFDVMGNRDNAATSAYQEIEARFSLGGEGWMRVLVTAPSLDSLAERVERAQEVFSGLQREGLLRGVQLDASFCPDPVRQAENRAILAKVLSVEAAREVRSADFFAEPVADFVEQVWAHWREWSEREGLVLPESPLLRRMLSRLLSSEGSEVAYMGSVQIAGVGDPREWEYDWVRQRFPEGVFLAAWEPIGSVLLPFVKADLSRVFLPIGLVLVGMLALAFRNLTDVLLTLGTLLGATLALLASMRVLGMEWNFLNLSAIPLVFGAGLDYSIHMIHALRRTGGNREALRQGIIRALFLCALSTMVGFGSLCFASNQGLASLGSLCALGIFWTAWLAIGILPSAWRRLHSPKGSLGFSG